jgi:hypothetical protein
MNTTSAHRAIHRASGSTARRAKIGVAAVAGCLGALTVPGVIFASETHPGCDGLYEHARFATYQQVDKTGETNGHDTVHHVFEDLGCGHHHG